ncbi:MAG: nitroreductase [Spirochaetae bacterium HGW-Spirochaetae-1]|jgi:nitroreductase|nr:MAG: nitroreductase [Spirochaetae bacterium HGW-Spirochaetae-1]
MKNNFDEKEAIMKRYSCRTYEKKSIEPATVEELRSYISSLGNGLFGSDIRFDITASVPGDSENLRGLGTYGFIRNPAGFVIGAMKKGDHNLEDYGFLMENITLKAASLGLDSCWLGGSFSRSSFAGRINAAADETVPAVLAIGYAAEKKRVIERVARWKMDADNRKAWQRIFFHGDFSTPLTVDEAGIYREALEFLRMAPSAVNYQPWRILKERDKNRFHFYLKRTKDYDENSFMVKSDLQRVDMGIAMSHFEAGAGLHGLKGKFSVTDSPVPGKETPFIYTATWKEAR